MGGVDIGDKFGSPFGVNKGLGELVSVIFSNALIIAGIVLLFLLIFMGISFIISAGQGNPEEAAKKRQAATSALIGFVIIFATFWIIKIIERITGAQILNPGL